jgi:hypothetical protein
LSRDLITIYTFFCEKGDGRTNLVFETLCNYWDLNSILAEAHMLPGQAPTQPNKRNYLTHET